MTNEELYVTDDNTQKSAILRQADKYGLGSPKDEVYWLKPTGVNGSPVTATVPPMGVTSDYRLQGDSNNVSSEAKRLLNGKPEVENEYSMAASPQHTMKNLPGQPQQPFYNVTFDDGQQIQVAGKPPMANRQQQQQQQVIKAGSVGPKTGSYMRFAEMEANQYAYDDHAHDVVTTFGTLPRGEYKRRRLLQGSDSDFQYPQYGGVGMASHQGSETGSITYASIHKTRPSPAPSSNYQTPRDYGRFQQQPDLDSNASRGSSYVNIPSSQHKHYGMKNNSWDANAGGRIPPGPPQARVIPTTSSGHSLRQKSGT